MPREISAGAVIFHQNKKREYLLLHYEWGHWDFSKGNIEEGENVAETIRRELKEETGLEDIKFITGFKETVKYFYRKEGKGIFKLVIFLLAQSKTKKVKLSYEHIGYEWLDYEGALEQLTFKNSKEILEKAERFLLKK